MVYWLYYLPELLACESAGHVMPSNCLSQCDVASLGVYKAYFFRSPKYGTVIDDVLRSLWFSVLTVR